MAHVEDQIISRLIFKNYSIDSLSFEKNNSFSHKKVNIDFDISSDICTHVETSSATVTLILEVFNSYLKKDYPFHLKMSVSGYFSVEPLVNENLRLIETNAVAILFPYLRSLVSTITANANVAPLILPPINVVELLRQKQQSETEQ
jgi:preprotein translocase subunit SecB